MTDTLPPGVHPLDPSVPHGGGDLIDPSGMPLPDVAGDRFDRGTPPFNVGNPDAMAVFQRAAGTLGLGVAVADANSSSTAVIVGRNKGRSQLNLWVPTSVYLGGGLVTVPNGALIAAVEGELQNGMGAVFLGIGDSISLAYEGPMWIGVPPGATVAYVQFSNAFDPPGGALGGQ